MSQLARDMYECAVAWVASEPGLEEEGIEGIETLSTVTLIAHLWDTTPRRVAWDVMWAIQS